MKKTVALILALVLIAMCLSIGAGAARPPVIFGDANGDKTVNGKDVLLLRKYLTYFDDKTGLSSVTVYPGADANNDGEINGRDLLLLRKYMANYDDTTGQSTISLE